MSIWTFYALGCLIAFIWGTNDYYEFKVRNNIYKGHIFDDIEDLFNMLVFSMGSWIAIILLIYTNDYDD